MEIRQADILEELTRRIQGGVYTDALPATRLLAAEFDVNGKTVDKAIKALVKDGTLHRVKGKGTFIRKEGDDAPAEEALGSIGVVVDSISERNWLFQTLMGIHQEADIAGLAVKFKETHRKFALEKKAVRELVDDGVRGLIVFPAGTAEENRGFYGRLAIPVVAIDCLLEGVTTDFAGVDNYRGAFDAVSYLLELGHRQIAFVMPEREVSAIKARHNGYLAALKAHGVPTSNDLIFKTRGNSDPEQSAAILRRLRELDPAPTAVFANNDGIALSLYAAAMKLGVRIPGDFSLVGFDNADMTEAMDLTTMEQPFADIGRAAVELLENRLAAAPRDDKAIHKILTPRLIKRGSTGGLA